MTSEQIGHVRSSWATVTARVDTLAEHFYAHLFDIDSGAAALFAGVDMAAQRTKLAKSLAVIVDTLDDPDRLLPALSGLGKRHASYGIQLRHFNAVGESLMHALGATLGDAFTNEVHDAWAIAYTLVSAIMQRAIIRASVAEATGA